MTNSRQAGKRWERWFVNNGLKKLFPNCRRNAGTQAQSGGVDIENTENFDIEIKGGKQCKIAKTRNWLDQVNKEGKKENLKVVLVKPLNEEPFVILPYDDWLELVERYLL